MSDLYNKDGQLLVSPGECWDRLTILELKSFLIANPGKQRAAAAEWRRVSQLIENIHNANCIPKNQDGPAWHLLNDWVFKLRQQNLHQWKCEDEVRTNKSWESAKAARDSNTARTHIKNQINMLYGYSVDPKEYAGEINED